MKNRIWRQIRRIGIAAAAAGAVLSAGFQPETVKSADLTDVNISIGQIGSWTNRENGKAELQIRVERLRGWLEQREAMKDMESTDKEQEDEEHTDQDQEREEEYEYVEELASGETVQQENEEQEETGASPQEGEAAGGEAVEKTEYAEPLEGGIPAIAPEDTAVSEEIPAPEAAQKKLTLVTYIGSSAIIRKTIEIFTFEC